MPHTKRTQNKEKMNKTIPLRVSASLAEQIAVFANKYEISQQDAMRLAIHTALQKLDEFLTAQPQPKKGEVK